MKLRIPRSRAARLALAAAGLVVGLVVAEGALRVAGFRYRLAPEKIEFASPSPEEMAATFDEDDHLFWVPRDYYESLGQLRAVDLDLVFLGDSCTQLGRYHLYLMEHLSTATGGGQVKGANLAVVGWTTFQGRRQLERDIVPLSPRVVTLFYGWNDHWVGFGAEDAEIAKAKAMAGSWLAGSRVVQALAQMTIRVDPDFEARPNRVSEDDFRDNLVAMVATARANGIEPVLVTAPSSHVEGRTPEYLLDRWLRSADELVPLHRAYADIVREVAAKEDVPLCDLERKFAAEPRQLVEGIYFRKDGIHCTDAGDRKIAEFLFECFEREGLTSRLRR